MADVDRVAEEPVVGRGEAARGRRRVAPRLPGRGRHLRPLAARILRVEVDRALRGEEPVLRGLRPAEGADDGEVALGVGLRVRGLSPVARRPLEHREIAAEERVLLGVVRTEDGEVPGVGYARGDRDDVRGARVLDEDVVEGILGVRTRVEVDARRTDARDDLGVERLLRERDRRAEGVERGDAAGRELDVLVGALVGNAVAVGVETHAKLDVAAVGDAVEVAVELGAAREVEVVVDAVAVTVDALEGAAAVVGDGARGEAVRARVVGALVAERDRGLLAGRLAEIGDERIREVADPVARRVGHDRPVEARARVEPPAHGEGVEAEGVAAAAVADGVAAAHVVAELVGEEVAAEAARGREAEGGVADAEVGDAAAGRIGHERDEVGARLVAHGVDIVPGAVVGRGDGAEVVAEIARTVLVEEMEGESIDLDRAVARKRERTRESAVRLGEIGEDRDREVVVAREARAERGRHRDEDIDDAARVGATGVAARDAAFARVHRLRIDRAVVAVTGDRSIATRNEDALAGELRRRLDVLVAEGAGRERPRLDRASRVHMHRAAHGAAPEDDRRAVTLRGVGEVEGDRAVARPVPLDERHLDRAAAWNREGERVAAHEPRGLVAGEGPAAVGARLEIGRAEEAVVVDAELRDDRIGLAILRLLEREEGRQRGGEDGGARHERGAGGPGRLRARVRGRHGHGSFGAFVNRGGTARGRHGCREQSLRARLARGRGTRVSISHAPARSWRPVARSFPSMRCASPTASPPVDMRRGDGPTARRARAFPHHPLYAPHCKPTSCEVGISERNPARTASPFSAQPLESPPNRRSRAANAAIAACRSDSPKSGQRTGLTWISA